MLSYSHIVAALLSLAGGGLYTSLWRTRPGDIGRWDCKPFLPNIFADSPPSPDHPAVRQATKAVDEYFTARFAQGGIDSLSVALVTSQGALFEKNFGTMRGNESHGPATHSHSMYRMASVSKLFAALEGMILEEKGALSWDDPVSKHLPGFKVRADGLDPQRNPAPKHAPEITLRQLASHTSGLGRDWPPGTATDWPHDSVSGGGPPPMNGLPYPDPQMLLDTIAKNHLVSPPGFYPSYSNTGTGVLGLALASASSADSREPSALSYAEVMKRDVFDPMGLNGSHFLATVENRHLIVVPSVEPEIADDDFTDTMNAAGGQFATLADAITVTQTILDPTHPQSLLSSFARDRWLKPIHVLEEDDWTEIGLVWEILKAPHSHGRLRKIYWKLGNVGGYHTAIAVHPGTSHGIVVFMAGQYADTAKLVYDAFALLQPAIDAALADAVEEAYAGAWVDDVANATTFARITVERGTLYMQELALLGVDALKSLGAPGRVAIRPSGWRDELRLDVGIEGLNGAKHMACFPLWNVQDSYGYRNGASINTFYFTGLGEERRLHFPSLSLVLKRT